MEEVQGQAETQPSIEDQARTVAEGLLKSEEPQEVKKEAPRDDKGKFAKQETPQEEPEAQAEEETPAEIRKHRLTIKAEDGSDQEVEVDEDELKKGYMLEKSYRQKTAQIAREREALQAKIKEAVEPKLKEYDDKLQLAEQAIWHTLAPEIQNTDWNKLAQENPAEWAARYQRVQHINARLAQVQQERQKIAKAREEEQRGNVQKQVQEAHERLKEEIPGWGQEVYGKILNFGKEVGFKPEEVNAITDHRAIKVLHDAMKYRELQAKPIVEKRTVPAAPKVVKPGAGEKPDAGADKWKEGMAKLKQSGRTDDAVALARMLVAREAKQQKQ